MEMERRMKSDDASSAIAAKLLQGWALLNDYCPQCINPLLRNREGRMYCVGCSQFVIRESDAPALVLENPLDRSQSPKDAATLKEPIKDAATLKESIKDLATLNEPAIQNGHTGSTHENLTASTPFQQVNLPSNMSAVLSQTLCTLVQKIEEMSKLIAVTHDPVVIKQVTRKRAPHQDREVMKGFWAAIKKIYGRGEDASVLRSQCNKFSHGQGDFGSVEALYDVKEKKDPKLQSFAIRLLS